MQFVFIPQDLQILRSGVLKTISKIILISKDIILIIALLFYKTTYPYRLQ